MELSPAFWNLSFIIIATILSAYTTHVYMHMSAISGHFPLLNNNHLK